MKYSDYIMIGVWIACVCMQYLGVQIPPIKSIATKKNIHRFIRTLGICTIIYPLSVFSTLTHFEVVIVTFLGMVQALISLEWENQSSENNLKGAKILALILQVSIIVVGVFWTLLHPAAIVFTVILGSVMLPRKYQWIDSGLAIVFWGFLIMSRIVA